MRARMDLILENSFRNFHAKGLDYLCLHRSPELTQKVYFFEEAGTDSAIVAPHDHRYDFSTKTLAGELFNTRFRQVRPHWPEAIPYEKFAWRSPLLGGDGFTYEEAAYLAPDWTERYGAGMEHSHRADEMHTIRVTSQTVIELEQLQDVVSYDLPTFTYLPKGMVEPPSLTGLYDKMTADRAMVLLKIWQGLTSDELIIE